MFTHEGAGGGGGLDLLIADQMIPCLSGLELAAYARPAA